MRKTVVIHQPDFIPYLGFFHRLLAADHFVILDHVKMSKRGWVHRDKIKTHVGEQWLSLPIIKLGESPIINKAKIDKNALFKKIPRVIEDNYRKAEHFESIFPSVVEIFEAEPESLFDVNLKFILLFMKWFDINVEISFSSEMNTIKSKSEMNAELVKKIEGSVYLSGVGARDYHDQTSFERMGIDVVWQEFKHPVYPQLHGDFLPYLSSLDLFLNCGVHGARDVLRSAL